MQSWAELDLVSQLLSTFTAHIQTKIFRESHLLFFTIKVSTYYQLYLYPKYDHNYGNPLFATFWTFWSISTGRHNKPRCSFLFYCFKLLNSNLGGILRESGELKNYTLISLVVFIFDQSRSSRDVLWSITDSNFSKYFMKLLGFKKFKFDFQKGLNPLCSFLCKYLLTRWARWVSLQANLDT